MWMWGWCIREEFDNGKHYYALHGQEILKPDDPKLMPDRGTLTWHNEQRING
jgi:putative restriction endonuclease